MDSLYDGLDCTEPSGSEVSESDSSQAEVSEAETTSDLQAELPYASDDMESIESIGAESLGEIPYDETADGSDSDWDDMEAFAQQGALPVDEELHNEYEEAKVLKRSEYDLLTTGNRNNEMILEVLRDDYQDKGLSDEEISRKLELDEERLQREYLDDAFPEQNVPTEVFDSVKSGTFSTDEWFGKKNIEPTEIQEDEGVPDPSGDAVEGVEYQEYQNFYTSIRNMELSEDYEKIILDKFNEMDSVMKAEYNEYADRLVCLDSDYYIVDKYGNVRDAAYFDSSEGGFKFNQELDMNNPLGAGNTFFHESAHMIDWLKGADAEGVNASAVNEMAYAAMQDYSDAIARIQNENGCSIEEAEAVINDELMNNPVESNTVSDIFGGITYNRVSGWYTHDNDYWYNRTRDAVGREAFAEITADRICNSQNLEFTKKYLPRTMEAYEKALKMRGERQ